MTADKKLEIISSNYFKSRKMLENYSEDMDENNNMHSAFDHES